MVIVGEWQLFDDGVTRPIVRAKVYKGDGAQIAEDFLSRNEILLLAPIHQYRVEQS